MIDIATQLDFLWKVILAGALGAIIGFERERARRPAGLRTHILVASAGAAVVLLNDIALQHLLDITPSDQSVATDPARILQAVFVGVGFIGGGTILKSQKDGDVHYLSTAASILFAGTIGVATAFGLYIFAAALALLTVIVNDVLFRFEKIYFQKDGTQG
jgi:putative Mg2+ transporter-C (MgtC) family protein